MMTPEQFQYILAHQDEWRQLYEKQRKKFKYEKGKAEKLRAKERLQQNEQIDFIASR